MKCPRCLAICMPTDPMCYSCRTPFARADSGNPYAPGPDGKPPLASRIGMVCGLLGACAGQIALMALFPNAPEDNMWLFRAVAAGVGAGVVGGIGFGLVALFTRGRSEPATPFDQPLRQR
jgi:hypothetical protein